ncbi:dentin sialophosphoprotein isoform X3 [Bradysia coprophila]|uniref:dentin sialophosphoprotein isoform X3 n=1 Tax=Bradysia coprophila TaxID=38358 RepID=UPI00187D7410|nr:dentin sialophosphoprotein isoform X3 [Bradysia coprophila]
MKNIVVVLLVTIVSLVSSKPIEEQLAPSDDLINNVHNLRPRRQLPDEITLNKQFFENIFQSSRISRDTSDGEAVPTIALHDLISSVEHTLIHSAQNLALSNITANLTATNADSSDSNNTSNVEQIVLPISVPTPTSSSPQPEELATESEGLTTVTEEDLIRDLRSNDESGSGHIETEYESVKPIEHSNLAEESNDAPVTEPTIPADPSNITILHTINATQTVPTAESDVVHVQQQQITFFSANAGVFPNIHALNAADLPSISQTLQTTPTVDCSGEETSDESTDSSSEEDSSSDSSSEEKEKTKKSGCTVKSSSVASSKPTESSTPSEEEIKKLKTDELKEQIAEVEADPVILTQGI